MFVLLLILVGTLLEILSLGLVLPVVALLTQDDFNTRYHRIASLLGDPSREGLIVLVMILLVVVYTIKGVFLFTSAWIQNRFFKGVTARLMQHVFDMYMHQSYAFHLQTNSAVLMRNVENASLIVSGVITPLLLVFADGVVSFGLFVLLITVEPLGTMIVLLMFGTTSLVFQRVTQSRITKWGKEQKYHLGKALQHLQQGFGGIKDVQILGREKEFLRAYAVDNQAQLRAGSLFRILQVAPRLWLEILTMAGLSGLVITMIAQGRDLGAVVPTLGLFAVTAFRVMPSVNRVLSSLQTVRYTRPFLDAIYMNLADGKEYHDPPRGALPTVDTIEFQNVSFFYENASRPAFSNVSLKIQCGEAIGFIGPSGVGKSTLVDVLLGLLQPSDGVIAVNGTDIQSCLRSWQDSVGYVPQSIFLIDDTIRRNVAFGIPEDEIDDFAVWEAIRLSQLDAFIKEMDGGISTIVGERGIRLSGGQRQRIGIARALYYQPMVMVLDEATSSLDEQTEREVMQAIQALHHEKTVIVVAHRLSTIAYCDRVYRLDNGTIADWGSLDDVLARERLIGLRSTETD